jgi:NAD(P)H-flavin reductase
MDPMIPQPYTVVRKRRETHDTVTLFMEPTDKGAGTMVFDPGQFNMLYLPGKGEAPISISGDPHGGSTLIHTIRGVGALTKALCAIGRGGVVGVRGPFGSSWPVKRAEGADIIIIAGGIGLAPLRPAFYHLLEHRDRYGRIKLLYGARSPQEMLYIPELEKWRSRFDIEVEVTVDNADSDWYGHVGVVTTLIPHAVFDPEDTVAMICGPEIMMRFTINKLLDHELVRKNIYVSYERNMKCALGFCGHCQFGPKFVCKDGPVFCFDDIEWLMNVREV